MEITTHRKKLASGIYLVADPSVEEDVLLHTLRLLTKEKIVAVQIWDHFANNQLSEGLIQNICTLCHSANIPVIINNRWEYLLHYPLDGVHFDEIPENFAAIKAAVNKPFISGLTCNNDVQPIHWAEANGLNYISFCSLFPSSTANSCTLVQFDRVREAAQIFNGDIFLAGGIRPDNMKQLHELDYTGIAVISGVMNSDKPVEALQEYYKNWRKIKFPDYKR